MGEIEKKELKKPFYIMLWVVLGALFAICIAGIVEFMSYRIANTLDLEVVLFSVMIIIGIIFGLFVGTFAWRMVYVEGKRGKKYLSN